MRFDPQSGFMPESDGQAPLPEPKKPRRGGGGAPRAGLRSSVVVVIMAVTGVLGFWIWREAVYGPQTAAADQVVQYLPDWLKETLDLEELDEETTILPVSTPDDAPSRVRSSSDVTGPGVDDAGAGDSGADSTDRSARRDETPRRHITLGPSKQGGNVAVADADEFGLTFQPPFKAKQAYEKGMAKAFYGRHKEAVVQFEEAVRIDPEFAQARYELALSLLKLGELDAAKAQHAELQKLQPKLAGKLAQRMP